MNKTRPDGGLAEKSTRTDSAGQKRRDYRSLRRVFAFAWTVAERRPSPTEAKP
jgi:hypothetical protein